jgi:hypothetical protein
MVVPPYRRSRAGRVFRVLRSSQLIAPDRMRLSLRAQPLGTSSRDAGLELACELDTGFVRDKIVNRQAIPTPEATLEQLWQQLSQDLDEHYG